MKDHYTYRVTWSEEDGEYVGLCVEFPSLIGTIVELKAVGAELTENKRRDAR